MLQKTQDTDGEHPQCAQRWSNQPPHLTPLSLHAPLHLPGSPLWHPPKLSLPNVTTTNSNVMCVSVHTTERATWLHRHMRLHTGNVFPCEEPGCEQVFTEKTKLALHHRVKHENQQHVCDVCGRKFSYKNALKSHGRNSRLRAIKCNKVPG